MGLVTGIPEGTAMTEKSPTYTIQRVEVNASPHSLPQREATGKWAFTCSHCSMPFFTLFPLPFNYDPTCAL